MNHYNRTESKTKVINGLSALCHIYDAYIVDVYGVLFDGVQFIESGVSAIVKLSEEHQRIVLLSNTSKTHDHLRERLIEVATQCGYIDFFRSVRICTSGDSFVQYFTHHNFNGAQNSIIIGGDANHDAILKINTELKKVGKAPLQITNDFAIADNVILLASTDTKDTHEIDNVLSLLSKAAHYKLPCMCANSDITAPHGTGHRMLCPGFYANKYNQLGQKVVFFGKPHEMIYKTAFNMIGADDVTTFKMSHKVLAIGDTMENDIIGAMNNDIDSLFIGDSDSVQRFNTPHHKQILPNYIMDKLKW